MYIAKPEKSNGKGVILIHEFWGLNNQMKKVAERAAVEGFLALAADLYEGKVTANKEEAGKLRDTLDVEKSFEILKKNLSYILAQYQIPLSKIAIWGFCMGGMVSFQAALRDIGAGAYVVYYGRITDDKNILKNLKKPILGIFGGLDKAIPKELVQRFGYALDELKKPHELHIFDDADHAFANEEREIHNPAAAAQAWEKTILFLDKNI